MSANRALLFDNDPEEDVVPDDDLSYFQHRAEEEVKRAQEATLPEVVAAHHILSELYLERVARVRESRRDARLLSEVGIEATAPLVRSITDKDD